MKQILYVIALVFLSISSSFGQQDLSEPLATREDSIKAAIDLDLAQYLPPLSVLVEVALQNSPEMNISEYSTMQQEYMLAKTRKDWTNFVGIGAQYRYGGVSGGVEDGEALLFPEDLSVGAYASFAVRIPLSYFVQRGDEIKAAEITIDIMQSREEAQRRNIEQTVVETYNELLLLQKQIQISSEARESSDLIVEMALERFRDGELSIDQLGATTSLKAKNALEYETLKSKFSMTYLRLERMIGMPISKLQNTHR